MSHDPPALLRKDAGTRTRSAHRTRARLFSSFSLLVLLCHCVDKAVTKPSPPPEGLTVALDSLDHTVQDLGKNSVAKYSGNQRIRPYAAATALHTGAGPAPLAQHAVPHLPVLPENPRLEDMPPGYHVAYHDSKGGLRFEWHPYKGFLRAHGEVVDPQVYMPLKHTLHDELDKLHMIVGDMTESPAKRTRFVYHKPDSAWLPFSGHFPDVVKQSAIGIKPKTALPTVRHYEAAHADLQGLPFSPLALPTERSPGKLIAQQANIFSGRTPVHRAASSGDLPPLSPSTASSSSGKLSHTKSDRMQGSEKPPRPVLNRSHSEAWMDHMDRASAPVFPYRYDLLPISPRNRPAEGRLVRRNPSARLTHHYRPLRR